MKIGLTYDLKDDIEAKGQDFPEDALEEYDSLEVIKAISAALRSMGHSTVRLGGGRQFLANIARRRVDMVFNISEGRGTLRSRESQVPAVLEMLDIPYSGSDPLTLAITLDKPLAKQIVKDAGVATPAWHLIESPAQLKKLKSEHLALPVFVKPAFEGSSKGIRLNSKADTFRQAKAVTLNLLKQYAQPVLIEQYIDGDEVTVGIIGNSPPAIVGIMRVVPRKKVKNFIYSLEVKRDWRNLVDYECPARLPKKVMQSIEKSALQAYHALGCRDFSRVDFRIGRDGIPYFLEVNPLPGLNPVSGDIVIMSGKTGRTYQWLIEAIVNAATARYGL